MTGFKCLAVPGPTNMPFEVRQAMDVALEDHRAPDFPDFTIPLLNDVKKIFRTETGHAIIFPGSGTGGWESAIANTLNAGDKVLTSSFGQFSWLWVDMCSRFGLDVHNVEVEWGRGVPLGAYREALEKDTNHEIKAVLVCHNETATGVTSSVKAVRELLDDLKHPALLFVDGVSSVGSLEFRMDDWGVDVAVSGSQKGFMLPTGLAIVGVSQKAMEQKKQATLPVCFFDFGDMIKMNAQGYFPYTPPVTLLRGLRASVDMLLDEGLDNVAHRHNRLAEGVRRAVTAWGLNNCAQEAQWHSDTVTAIKMNEGQDANAVIQTAYHDYKVSLGAGLSVLNGKVFRIGHLGWLNETMVLQALGGVELAMRKVGVAFEAGSGVGAAIDFYTETAASNKMAAE
ncbi:MAG: serine--glyoxylate aminotransferase [SAR116 cluster bacterium MED-G04]|nr:MAG: serine--glyoxylate aminotransferase [SAR116 cluster bacterium MED-G04]CAI8415920.1 MAG: Serine-pyruvate aminotransferase [SAR116 cluster bacterium MED-G04]HCV63007.1 serine--glyoxylate aminotransferase [Alphaproteobacteria bacterium]